MTPTPTRWKPPMWLLAIDAVGIFAVGIGLFIKYNPQATLANGPLGALQLPLLVVGGLLCASGAVAAARLALGHLRSGT